MFKTKVAAALALVFIASSASASPLFQVQEGAITEASANLVTADKLTLRYEAAINQTAGGSFTETGYFNVTALGLGNAVAPSQLNLTEGLLGGAGYGL